MQIQRLFDLFHYQQVHYPQVKALGEKATVGWSYYSAAEAVTAVDEVSVTALQLGWKKGTRIGILVEHSRRDALFLDLGLQQIGAIVVPLSAQLSDADLLAILVEVQLEVCIVEDRLLYDRLVALSPSVLSLKIIYSLAELPNVPYWNTQSITAVPTQLANLQAVRASLHEDDVATIVYEASIDGTPKGFALSHKNIMTQVITLQHLFPIEDGKVVVSLLPIDYLSDRVLLYTYIYTGASIYFLPTLESLLDDLKTIRPYFASASPALIRKLYQQITRHATTLSPTRQRIYKWALQIGEQYPNNQLSFLHWIKWRMASYLVFNSWRKLVGNRLLGIVVNGTGLPPAVIRLFNAAGLTLREAGGCALTSGWLASNQFLKAKNQVGTAGLFLSSVEWRLEGATSKGRLLVKGESVGVPLKAPTVQLADDWQRTPLTASIDASGYVIITATNRST
jgi:long-chain acyl-CoA synthetase